MMCSASRASRSGLAVGILRVLCNGLCTTKRFHVVNDEQLCRLGCLDEPDCLCHYNMCPRLSDAFKNIWRNAGFRLCDDLLLHDLLTQTLLHSIQHGIVVMGIIDAFVYAHNVHRQNNNNPGKFEDCTEGRIRLMTAITPAYAHAFQAVCLTRHPMVIPHQKFRLPTAKAKYPNLPINRTMTRQRGSDHRGWAVFTDGGTHSVDGETTAVWSAVARSPDGRCYVMFGPVITSEAHFSYARANLHTNNTVELSGIIEVFFS